MAIHTENALRDHPGIVFAELQLGGLKITDENELVDKVDLRVEHSSGRGFVNASNLDSGTASLGIDPDHELHNEEDVPDSEEFPPDDTDTEQLSPEEKETERLVIIFGGREDDEKPKEKGDTTCPPGCNCSCYDKSKGAHARVEGRHKESHCTSCASL